MKPKHKINVRSVIAHIVLILLSLSFVSSSILWKEKTIIYSMLAFHSLLYCRSSENGVEKVLSEVFVALVENGERYS